MNKEIKILDVTIRDGSYSINYQYTPDQVGRISHELDRAGIPLIEVSHGCGLGAHENVGLPAAASDEEYVIAAKDQVSRAGIGVIALPEIVKRKQIDAIIDKVDFIRFAANVDNIQAIRDFAEYAINNDVDVFVQMMRSSRLPVEAVVAAAKEAQSLGAKTVYLVDTNSYFMPQDVTRLVETMKENIDVDVGFHAHNNLGMAIANTLSAIEAGCDAVDGSLRGMGRAAGNAQLEALVSLMKRMNLAKSINLDVLLDAGERLVAPIMPPSKGITAVDISTADVNIGLYPLEFYQMIADELDIKLRTFIRYLGTLEDLVEVDFSHLRRAINHYGKDPKEIFDKLGVKPPREK